MSDSADESARVQRYFKSVAPDWDQLRQTFFTDEVRDAAIARSAIGPDSIVGDVGTGTGFMLAGLAPLVKRAYGFDASAEMLAVAAASFQEVPNVELKVAEGTTLPVPDGSLDAVFGNMYLHHCPDPAAAIAELARVVRPGGRVVLTDVDQHQHEWMREEMADLWLGFDRMQLESWYLAAGLRDVKVESSGCT